jgi:hypothetical protein
MPAQIGREELGGKVREESGQDGRLLRVGLGGEGVG